MTVFPLQSPGEPGGRGRRRMVDQGQVTDDIAAAAAAAAAAQSSLGPTLSQSPKDAQNGTSTASGCRTSNMFL